LLPIAKERFGSKVVPMTAPSRNNCRAEREDTPLSNRGGRV
jgi:hypothetical protein